MFYNDNDNKDKPGFNAQAFKHAIGMIESSGGKHLSNSASSAAGKYHFLYNSIKHDPSMKGISKQEFINRPDLQEEIMDKALAGELQDFPYGEKYANKLQRDYQSKYNVNQLSALVHFLGPGNTRKFLKDPENFKVPGKSNISGHEYLKRFDGIFKQHEKDNAPKPAIVPGQPHTSLPSPPRDIRGQYPTQPIDNTRVANNKPAMDMSTPEYPSQHVYDLDLNGTNSQNEANSFKEGGDIDPTDPPAENDVDEIEYPAITEQSEGLIREFSHKKNNRERFQATHKESKGSCLAGALNCGTGGEDGSSFGYLKEFLPNHPSLRSYLDKGDVSKYRTNDVYTDDVQGFVPNTSIDAWEIHDYMRGEGLGYDPYDGVEFTYEQGNVLPDQVLANPSALPIGTIIGQGRVNEKNGYQGYDKANNSKGRNRHAMSVVGYDEKDGVPLIYDYGEERRLDDVLFTYGLNGPKKITNFTTPNEYRNTTYAGLKEAANKRAMDLGYSNDDSLDYVPLNSTDESIKAIEKGANSKAKKISDFYQVPKSTIDKFIGYLPGLSFTETKLNNNEGYSKTVLSDSFVGNTLGVKAVIKALGNTATAAGNVFRDEDSTRTSPWEAQIDFRIKNKGNEFTKEEEDAYINSVIENNSGKKKYEGLSNSVGAFKIKDLSKFAEKNGIEKSDLYGIDVSNSTELKRGAEAALSLLAEKYKTAIKNTKKMGLKLTDDQLIDLTLVGYKNNSKFTSKKYIEEYILNKSKLNLPINSVDKIKSYEIKGQVAPDQRIATAESASQSNQFKEGGQMDGSGYDASQLVTIFEGGGTHEQNPYGGIAQGEGKNGKPNLVEEGETKWKDYIFSNAFTTDGLYTSKEGKKSNVFEQGGELSNSNCGGPGQPPCDEKYFQTIRDSRQGHVRKNEDGSESTHLMADNNKDKAFPTLFRNEDGSWDDFSNNHDAALKRATADNEIYSFNNKEDLTKFAREGSWKEPNSFKQGGELNPTDPPAGIPTDPNQYVNAGSNEYVRAQNEGTFANQANQLDEVVLQSGIDYKKYPFYNELTQEEKSHFNDSGPIGAGIRRKAYTKRGLAEDAVSMAKGMLVDTPGAVMQASQSALVEGIEAARGNKASLSGVFDPYTQRTPSNTFLKDAPLGFQIAGDMLVDPSAIVGLPASAKSLLKLATSPNQVMKIIKNVPELAKGMVKSVKNIDFNTTNTVRKNSLKNHTKKIKNKFKKTIENIQDKTLFNTSNTLNELNPFWNKGAKRSGQKQMTQFSDPNNPAVIKRYENYGLGKERAEEVAQKIADYEPKDYQRLYEDILSANMTEEWKAGALNDLKTSNGLSYGVPNRIYTDTKRRTLFGKKRSKDINSVEGHELSHLSDRNGKELTPEMQADLWAALNLDKQKYYNLRGGSAKYLGDPTEIRARINQARHALKKKPEDVFTAKDYDKIEKEHGWFNMSEYFPGGVNKEAMIKVINKIPMVAGAAGLATAGASTQSNEFKEGGDLSGPTDPPKGKKPVAPDNSQRIDNTYTGAKNLLDSKKFKLNDNLQSLTSILDESDETARKKSRAMSEYEYYHPKVEKGITTGDPRQDFLYNNQYLMDIPLVGGYIKDKIKEKASKSGGRQHMTQDDIENSDSAEEYMNYTGSSGAPNANSPRLLDQYFSEEPLLELATNSPKSDYYPFLKTYSARGKDWEKTIDTKGENDWDESPRTRIDKQIQEVLQRQYIKNNGETDIDSEEASRLMFDQFMKDKKTIYSRRDDNSYVARAMNADLGGHGIGIGYDEDSGYPYMSVSDAWDFEPRGYTKKWGTDDPNGIENEEKRQLSKIQSSIMHKAGHPYKLYDRFYINPSTGKYMSSAEMKKLISENKKK